MSQVGNKNIDNASGQVVRTDIENTIAALEPRAQEYEVNVEELPEDNEYRIQIKFYVQDQLEPIEFETFLSRVR